MPKSGEPKQHVPVFVGSTYEDLKEYREAVREALHRLETIVHGMEYFGSKPQAPKEECLKAVNSSKAYIGIFAMRYGSIDPESQKSMTHIEYDEAQKLRLPTLIYVIDEEHQPVLPKFVDTGENAKKLSELKEEIKKKYQVSFFTSPDDLAKRVTQDLPSVLEGIGVVLEQEPQTLVQADSNEILKRFWARPAKYAGREITVRCKVTGEVVPVGEQDCLALRLPLGDTIERKIEQLDPGRRVLSIIANGQIADWLEELPKESEVTVRIKLLSGTRSYVEWNEGEPEWTTRLVRGFQVTGLISEEVRATE